MAKSLRHLSQQFRWNGLPFPYLLTPQKWPRAGQPRTIYFENSSPEPGNYGNSAGDIGKMVATVPAPAACPGSGIAEADHRGGRRVQAHHDTNRTERLLADVEQGDTAALDELIRTHRGYLLRVVGLRMDEELLGRVDPSDIVQETQLVAARRIEDFLARRPTSFRIWLRRKALEQIVNQRRHHLGARRRTVRREKRLAEVSSMAIARHLLGDTPSRIVANRELAEMVRRVISQMKPADREILLLRHVEDLTNAEVAELLGVTPDLLRKRHGRAFRRLCERLGEAGFFADGTNGT
jgi:RNA polymerase sigma-70 factor, ECF subfamily